MDGLGMPERVEVELTPRAGGPGRRGRGGDDEGTAPSPIEPGPDVPVDRFVGAPDAAGDTSSDPPPTPGRSMAIVAAVGAVALVLGFLLGRAGGGASDDAAAPPAPTTIATRAAPVAEELPRATAPEVTARAVPAAPARPPGTTMALDLDRAVGIDGRLLGAPFEIVTLAPGRRLLEIDLLAGIVESRSYDSVVLGSPSLYVGDDWALILTAFDARPSVLFEGDAAPVETEVFARDSAVLARPGEEFFWRLGGRLNSVAVGTVQELDRTGTPTGRTIDVPRVPRSIDPKGGLVVEIPGGVFTIDFDGSAQRITTGRLLALSTSSGLAQECDETLTCQYVVIDRLSGDRTPVPLPPEVAATVELSGEDWWSVASPFSPDDSAVALVWHRPDSAMIVVIELVTGELVELAQVRGPASAMWAPDGAYLFFLDGTRLRAWERATGELFDVIDVPVEIGVGVRSSGAG